MKIFETLKTAAISIVAAVAIVMVGFSPVPVALRAQSSRIGGRDVPSNSETWFQRLGLLNSAGGCDVALEYDALNTARFTNCGDAASLADLKVRGATLNGVPTSQGAAGADALLTKTVSSIANNVATTVLTVTVPNAGNAATIPLVISASLGAGGSVAKYECTATAYGQVVVTRTAGLAAVASAIALSNTGNVCVSGAETITLAYAVTAMVGANSATQTFTVTVTILANGFATNHVAIIQADVLNAAASGITVS